MQISPEDILPDKRNVGKRGKKKNRSRRDSSSYKSSNKSDLVVKDQEVPEYTKETLYMSRLREFALNHEG